VGDPARVRKPNKLEINLFTVVPPSYRQRKEIIASNPTSGPQLVEQPLVMPVSKTGGKKKEEIFAGVIFVADRSVGQSPSATA